MEREISSVVNCVQHLRLSWSGRSEPELVTFNRLHLLDVQERSFLTPMCHHSRQSIEPSDAPALRPEIQHPRWNRRGLIDQFSQTPTHTGQNVRSALFSAMCIFTCCPGLNTSLQLLVGFIATHGSSISSTPNCPCVDTSHITSMFL